MSARFKRLDMVRVGSDSPIHGEVLDTASTDKALRRGRLKIRVLCGHGTREVRTAEVTGHWRRMKS